MTPQERDLIQGVFDRLARSGVGQKDAEAERMIQDQMPRVPDAAYGLVQAVIVQEMGLNQATARINELQRQLDETRAAAAGAPTGGFLSGAGPWGGGSVPRSGPQAAYAPAAVPAAGPGYAQQAPAYAPQPSGPWGQPQQQPSAAGGFLRNAATMAAGVAGGTLIAEGLSSMFGGHRFGGGLGGGFGGGLAGGSPWGGGPTEIVENVTNNYYGDQAGGRGATEDASYQDASYQDTSVDDAGAGFDGGFDDTSDV
ncbi:DUF2076 domain-containing protein [Telmatospirillum siberiense]|uniref:DUF2076 domain-containing protein n=1 Tax=Telmatospirillum siberiense TaxID=382514 RepID=A0A2N3PTR3_9PROT|nr:DUF2076 domain-containing protein [Telmatospirillum siberiense]PKU23789.1 DUF2076 domain-containing protein [Telmatospirillum siberiense]